MGVSLTPPLRVLYLSSLLRDPAREALGIDDEPFVLGLGDALHLVPRLDPEPQPFAVNPHQFRVHCHLHPHGRRCQMTQVATVPTVF